MEVQAAQATQLSILHLFVNNALSFPISCDQVVHQWMHIPWHAFVFIKMYIKALNFIFGDRRATCHVWKAYYYKICGWALLKHASDYVLKDDMSKYVCHSTEGGATTSTNWAVRPVMMLLAVSYDIMKCKL